MKNVIFDKFFIFRIFEKILEFYETVEKLRNFQKVNLFCTKQFNANIFWLMIIGVVDGGLSSRDLTQKLVR